VYDLFFPLTVKFFRGFPAFFYFPLYGAGAVFQIGNGCFGGINNFFRRLFQRLGVFLLKMIFYAIQPLAEGTKFLIKNVNFVFGVADPFPDIFHKRGFIFYAGQIFLHPARHLDQFLKRGIIVPYPVVNLGKGLHFLGKLFPGQGLEPPHKFRGGFSLHFKVNAVIFNNRALVFYKSGDFFFTPFRVFFNSVIRIVAFIQKTEKDKNKKHDANSYQVAGFKQHSLL